MKRTVRDTNDKENDNKRFLSISKKSTFSIFVSLSNFDYDEYVVKGTISFKYNKLQTRRQRRFNNVGFINYFLNALYIKRLDTEIAFYFITCVF